MRRARFDGSFTQQRPIPPEGIEAAVEVLRSGRLHRYNVAPGEEAEAAALEREFAAFQGTRFALAVASGGQAMQIALRAAGVAPGAPVLTNAFTLAPVPGSILAVGARPVLVESTEDLVIDIEDLLEKARRSASRTLLLSHMRGHLCDMDRLTEAARRHGIRVIEDCAHTMGALWNGRRSGAFGLAGCFSTQTYKHLNSGEGGLLVSDDPDFMARATMLSGCYMLYDTHGAGPDPSVFADIRLDTPNMSARMDNLRAAILRPQLRRLPAAVAEWNLRHDRIVDRLAAHPAIRVPHRPPQECYVGSSVQFRVPALGPDAARRLVEAAAERGVDIKWFGDPEPVAFTSTYRSWRYVAEQPLPRTDRILATLFDMRLPLTFTPQDCDQIATHLTAAVDELGVPAE